MGKLPQFEQEILEILKQLLYCCQQRDLFYEEKIGVFEVMFSDIRANHPKGLDSLYNAEKYLQANGVNFIITFDFMNDIPDMYIDSQHPDESFIQLGTIEGNIREIISKIKKLISKLSPEDSNSQKDKEYSDINEPIKLNTLGITIEEESISFKNKREEINPADRAIIKYLYYRYIEEPKQCVKIDILAKDLGLDEGYIRNRITEINKKVDNLVLDGRKKSNLDEFIKNERKRGYHLNPRFVTQFTNKK